MPTMTSWAAATAFLLALSCSPGAFGQGRTGWRYHLGPTGLPKPQACPAAGCYYPGSGMQAKADSTIIDWASSNCTVIAHGDPCEYDSPAAMVPEQGDLNWIDCGNGDVDAMGLAYCPSPATINAIRKSQLAPTCFKVLDFTFFETQVTIPPLAIVSAFTIAFDGMDDGSRITIFNSAHPTGLVVAGSYVYLGGNGTSNLKDFVVVGNNRVVITQVDDCTSRNNLQSAIVTLNGMTVSCGDCDDLDPCTTDYCSVESSGDGVCKHDPIPDAIAPEITCPADISADVDAGTCGAVVSFAADARDNCPVGLGYTCDTPSGSTFPVGSTTVTCTATDTSGNNNSCQFAVTVTDDEAPAIELPQKKKIVTLQGYEAGACQVVAKYNAIATDNCALAGPVTCTSPSAIPLGSRQGFSVGSHNVTCTATDRSGNSATRAFTFKTSFRITFD